VSSNPRGTPTGVPVRAPKTRVLIVDDSALVRRVLTEGLAKYPDIEVVGTASDPYIARERIVQLTPDVVTLDIEMPRMDGLSFLSKLMRHYPIPVIVVSSLTTEHSETALRALALGAIDVIAKPGSLSATTDVADALAKSIRVAAQARVQRPIDLAEGLLKPRRPIAQLDISQQVIAIGASTGGTQAIETLLRQFPSDAPGTVIVQHMPELFTASFARRLNELCSIHVREARDGDVIAAGLALIAPGDKHLVVQQSGSHWVARVKDGPRIHHQRPAVDVLFQSVARAAGHRAVGVLLTGMGADGARGLLAMREAGAHTIAQDQDSCVVFGMPREAIRMGAAEEVLPLDKIARQLLYAASAARAA
jgi:two-component system, chemotaxis family, protein-glutamate methylesterase/glutaminase